MAGLVANVARDQHRHLARDGRGARSNGLVTIGKVIENHTIVASREQLNDGVRADEACTTGDEDFFMAPNLTHYLCPVRRNPGGCGLDSSLRWNDDISSKKEGAEFQPCATLADVC